MKAFGLTWSIFINTIAVIIVLTVFSIPSTKFESVIVALLVLIWLSITGFSAQWGLAQFKTAQSLDNDFGEIKRLLNGWKNIEDYTDEYLKEVTEERRRFSKNIMTKIYLNSGFQFVLFIIALYNLLIVIN